MTMTATIAGSRDTLGAWLLTGGHGPNKKGGHCDEAIDNQPPASPIKMNEGEEKAGTYGGPQCDGNK